MSIYLNNYWSLYSEFINVLKNLKYREIPIALMTNFYQQIDTDLKIHMEQEEFAAKLTYASIKKSIEIQPFFEKMLVPLKKPLKTMLDGKILINLDYTRIPVEILHDHFSGEHTMVLSRSKTTDYYGIPNEYIGNFKRDTSETSKQLMKTAYSILAKYKDHPAFSNSFFIKTFIQRIPIIVDALETILNLFDEKDIATVLIGSTEDVVSRSLAIVASMKGIPNVCLQHGILMGEEAFIPVFSSHIAVYGEYEKRWYVARGLEEERIVAIGHPRYDKIFSCSSRVSRKTLLNEYDLDPNKITLLIITGPNLEESKFKKMISELAGNQNFQFLIKPHPWELGKRRIKLYTELESEFNSVHVIRDRKINTHDLIFHTDAVVSALSTVALESCLFNKPVFVYYFIQSNRLYDYYNRLGHYIQSDPIELVKIITIYFNSPNGKTDYIDVKEKFLLDSYRTENSGEELSNLIFQLTKVRPK
ncbi:CDP-glycerol glycerophosphotransferase family protein [Metabacillus bambusae]|uniref:CDP-glycerol glycerophosphotransferase family protein n=1 Tax=Metabacillus bambusae TaxID=2795218 RepID=A0ABS3N550_9BACI|nr:CDP-glycerol glycerophosphotransferase family protein [Metabacillus bambusae]MBO1513349.1 CDP-glycerol glycerophosphotransferase family protein [Metabacillus bambusae]